MGNRQRTYTLFADYHGGPFTTRVRDYRGGTHGSCIYEVRANSIKQAYFLARQGQWAPGPGEVGLLRRRIRSGDGPGRWDRAPYLRGHS